MGIKYNRIKFRVSSRSEWVLGIQHAENNGFVVSPDHEWKIERYRGSKAVINVRLDQDDIGLNPKSWDSICIGTALWVDTLDDFKHAVNCFCHDGYLDVDNLKVV